MLMTCAYYALIVALLFSIMLLKFCNYITVCIAALQKEKYNLLEMIVADG